MNDNYLFEGSQSFAHPRYVSHRGFQPLAPENSLPSFACAGLLGQWAIETDVRMSRDGVLVCIHNDTVDATYDGEGAVADKSWAELSKLRINQGNRLNCLTDAEKRMPRFSEYLEICKKFGSVPFIELKIGDVQPVIHAVHEAGFRDDQVVMSSSCLDWLIETRRQSSDMFVHWIFAREDGLDTLAALGNAGLSWNYADPRSCPQEVIRKTKEAGLRMCLRAGDSVEDVEYMLKIGLDYIPSNCMHSIWSR